MTFEPAAFKQNNYTYEITAPASRIKLDCQAIAAYDRQMEKWTRIATIATILGFLGMFAAFFGAVIINQPWVLYLLAPLAIGSLVVGFILQRQWRRVNIPDARYQLLPELLDTLSRDMAHNAPLQLKLHCTPTTHKQKLVTTVPHPSRRGWKVDCFQDAWLQLGGQLVDGTDFTVALTEMAVAKYGWKRSRSGKSKFKRKEKPKGAEITLDLQFPRKRYGALKILQEDVQKAIHLPPDVQLKGLKISDRNFVLTVKIPAHRLSARDLHNQIKQLFLNAYHVLTLAQELSKPNV
jgi:hypothetical protein